jgi:hypothetical protein
LGLTGWLAERRAEFSQRIQGLSDEPTPPVQIVDKFINWRTIGLFAAVGLLLPWAATLLRFTFLPALTPPPEATGLIWQVHATITSIGLAGLALVFQLGQAPPMAAESARAVLTRVVHAPELVGSAALSNLLIGIMAVWFDNEYSAFSAFFVLSMPTLALTSLAYIRLVWVFSSQRNFESMAESGLLLRLSQAFAETEQLAGLNNELVQALARSSYADFSPAALDDGESGYLVDSIVREVREIEVTLIQRTARLVHAWRNPTASTDTAPSEAAPKTGPALRLRVLPGSRVRSREPIFAVRDADLTQQQKARLSALLAASVRVSRP